MTQEEAIQVLESMKSEESYNAPIDLCNVAIEALKKEAERQEMIIRASEKYLGLVRCKDCKWQKFIDWGMGDCLHPKGSRHIAYDNHYCSYGERREP